MIEALARCEADPGARWNEHIGYFATLREAKIALRGLCPWDFNDMWGFSDHKDFIFKEIPATLNPDYNLADRDAGVAKARKHAERTKGSWHRRAPDDWE